LAQFDPTSAAKISPSDTLRIVRALEIAQQTGTPASVLREAHRFAPERYPHTLYVLSPPRDELYAAIANRTRKLFDQGLVQETEKLVREGFREAPPMESVGYRQALQVVEGRWTLDQAIEDTIRETRRYAKRQLTWFRREPGARWLAPPYALG
jgi:tRNA dimethylallyltransferase